MVYVMSDLHGCYDLYIPLYKNERNFIVKNGVTKFLPKLLKEYGANIFVLNETRKKYNLSNASEFLSYVRNTVLSK